MASHVHVYTVEAALLQDEVETSREELTFKDHRISELEQALRGEKEHSASLTTDVQVGPTATLSDSEMV